MDIQRKNQIKHAQESLQKKLKMEEQLAPVRVQNTYNKENLKTQHEYNLEIFNKQKKLTITIAIISTICSLITGTVGVLLGYYLSTIQQPPKSEIQQKISITQPQNISDNQKVQAHPETNTKSSGKEVSSSKNVSSEKSP